MQKVKDGNKKNAIKHLEFCKGEMKLSNRGKLQRRKNNNPCERRHYGLPRLFSCPDFTIIIGCFGGVVVSSSIKFDT